MRNMIFTYEQNNHFLTLFYNNDFLWMRSIRIKF